MSSEQSHAQYGNNFYLLFEAIRIESTHPEYGIIEIYLRRAEKLYAEQWKKFLDENASLMNEIMVALEGINNYSLLCEKYIELLRARDWDQADLFAKDTNLKSVGIAAWNVLNPLLEKAGRKMAEYGIDQEEFFG